MAKKITTLCGQHVEFICGHSAHSSGSTININISICLVCHVTEIACPEIRTAMIASPRNHTKN